KRVKVGTLDYMDAVLRWAGCHPVSACETVDRLAFKGKSDFVNAALPNQAITTLLSGIEAGQADPAIGHCELLFDPYGGAINHVAPGATAFVHRRSLFSIQYFTSWTGQTLPSVHWIRNVHNQMRPFVSGFAYQNYIDHDLKTWKHAY